MPSPLVHLLNRSFAIAHFASVLIPACLWTTPALAAAPLAGLHWLHQPETQLSLGLVGAAGYAALSAPVLPGAREQEVVTALHSGQPMRGLLGRLMCVMPE
jgi:hypothetical protein